MTTLNPEVALPAFPWAAAAAEYAVDRWQRNVLFWDVLRQRGNGYFDHVEAGQPPVLVFEYETILDARTFDRPTNYALLRICDRRHSERDRRPARRGADDDRRDAACLGARRRRESQCRPVVIIDPRAGHGPGIGGSKLNSQIGVALDYGHPVYFVMFFPDPEPGQTLADVHQAEIRFLEEVARRHPRAPKPAVVGNCQAGWATALIGADRPDLTGPLVLNGSPLSYWGGVEGAHPMRYKGGLSGGAWLTSLWCDLGNGRFDGANLVAGFEDLNPANSLWSKLYHLFANVDTEEQRFLTFEKWWGGFFTMNAAEIHFIVEKLFIGNSLEQGVLELTPGRPIRLENIDAPILVFASGGDNITPPPQALNWIRKVYRSVADIKRQGQVIIYMVHAEVGHLGIFVSGEVAGKEHREIIGSLEMLDYLSPGLYEMVIEGDPSRPALDDYQVGFRERDLDDLLVFDDGSKDEEAFSGVAAWSRFNDGLYNTWCSPWVRLAVTEPAAEMIRLLHPLRVQRYALSNVNPLLYPLKWLAPAVKTERKPARPDNPFVALEKLWAQSVESGWNTWRDLRDQSQELLFQGIYGNPWMTAWLGGAEEAAAAEHRPEREAPLPEEFDAGGFAEALVRIMIAVAGADRLLDRRQFASAKTIIQSDARLRGIEPQAYRGIIRQQARLLDADRRTALQGLGRMLPLPADRRHAMAAAQSIACADRVIAPEEEAALAEIREVLGLPVEH